MKPKNTKKGTRRDTDTIKETVQAGVNLKAETDKAHELVTLAGGSEAVCPNGDTILRSKVAAEKTDLKDLISKYGIMSTDMQQAVQYDQSSININMETGEEHS